MALLIDYVGNVTYQPVVTKETTMTKAKSLSMSAVKAAVPAYFTGASAKAQVQEALDGMSRDGAIRALVKAAVAAQLYKAGTDDSSGIETLKDALASASKGSMAHKRLKALAGVTLEYPKGFFKSPDEVQAWALAAHETLSLALPESKPSKPVDLTAQAVKRIVGACADHTLTDEQIVTLMQAIGAVLPPAKA